MKLTNTMTIRCLILVLSLATCRQSDDVDEEPVTYHRDVRPILDRRCGDCHRAGGISGLVLDGSPALTPLMLQQIESGSMPPWPPGSSSLSLLGDRRLTGPELAKLYAWAAAGSPQGNASEYVPPMTHVSPEPSQTLLMPQAFHPSKGQSDQYRCFLLGGLADGWITGFRWILGNANAAHHVGGVVLDAAGVATLRQQGLDGPDGFDCPGDFGPARAVAALSSTGVGPDTQIMLPKGAGISAAAGGAVVMQIHYLPDAVPAGGDRSGVSLWLDRSAKRAIVEYQFTAPVELPCALGVSNDPYNRCSREYAFTHDALRTPNQARADSDLALSRCGQTLQTYYSRLPWQQEPQDTFRISTSCIGAFPVDGDLLGVHLHMHTRGQSGRIEVKQPDGSWLVALDIPRWRWTWESAYLLADPISVRTGQAVRVSCEIDNGSAAQWGPAGPGHDGPAIPPLELPAYRVGGVTRESEMCAAFLEIETK